MFLDDDSDLPQPLFTPEEEAAASSFAAAVLARCGYEEVVPDLLNATTGLHDLQCLG
jgi:hypothetical protein